LTQTFIILRFIAMQRCAPEIWGEIFRQIDGSRKQKNESLKAMCLAFKAVAPYAQAELFTDVTISSAAAAERLLQLSLLKPTLLQRNQPSKARSLSPIITMRMAFAAPSSQSPSALCIHDMFGVGAAFHG
jgi:hypothetical protein